MVPFWHSLARHLAPELILQGNILKAQREGNSEA
jgi:hypothetical protein